ncbi:MAG: DUF4405 domain-containing protein [Actinomycetota bacterium]|nr:DUF4405 domain-containing protein [Actinomycetota bacterium]
MTTTTLERPSSAAPPSATARSTKRATPRRALRLYVVDAILLVSFVLLMDVPLTGLAVHEWLGVVIGVGIVTHSVQHAAWMLNTSRRMLKGASLQNRIHYLMMVALFVGFLTAVLSGFMISEVVMEFIGIDTVVAPFWTWLHLVSVQAVLWLTALHVALNWKWVVRTSKRFLGKSNQPAVRRTQ